MSIYKRGNTYWLNVAGSDGRQIRVSAKTSDRQAAVRKEAELRVKLGLQVQFFDIAGASTSSVTFGQLADEFLKHQAALGRRSVKSFFAVYVRQLRGWFKGQRLADITPRMVERYRAERLSQTGISTANRSIAVLRRALGLAVRWGYIERNPVVGLDPLKEGRRVYRVLTPAEQAAYLSACRPDFKTFAWLALRTGMRRGELQDLRVRDVDTWRSLVSLPQTKAGVARHIPVLPKVAMVLGDLQTGKKPESLLLVDQRGEAWTHTVLRRCHANAARQAGVRQFRFHDLRHTFASDLLASNAPMHIVQALLGHASMKTTEIYAHLAPAQVREALKAFESFLAVNNTASDTI